jgi:hypothetical protein
VLAAVAGVALVTAGCGDDPEPEALPSFTASASATAPDDETAVEAAYLEYEDAFEAMAASGDPQPARLRPYATPERAQKDAENLSLLFDEDYRVVGSTSIDVRSVTVTGEKAVVEACIDASKWITVKTGESPAPGETGEGSGLARVDMVKQDGRWLVSESAEAGAC